MEFVSIKKVEDARFEDYAVYFEGLEVGRIREVVGGWLPLMPAEIQPDPLATLGQAAEEFVELFAVGARYEMEFSRNIYKVIGREGNNIVMALDMEPEINPARLPMVLTFIPGQLIQKIADRKVTIIEVARVTG